METTTDGFKLAEIDLQYRGPGDFLGVRQAGETDIPLELLTDTSFLGTVQEAAHVLMTTQSQERLHTYLYDGEKNSRENLLV